MKQIRYIPALLSGILTLTYVGLLIKDWGAPSLDEILRRIFYVILMSTFTYFLATRDFKGRKFKTKE